VTTATVTWASVAKIEKVITVQGKLEPQGKVKELKVPLQGVVNEIHVEDGDLVKKGEPLLTLDYKVHQSKLKSLQKIRSSLQQENQFYQSQITGKNQSLPISPIPPQFVSLTRNRATLVTENRLLQAQYDGTTNGISLTVEQQQRITSERLEAQSRITTARLEIEQLQRQLNQAQIQLQANRKKLDNDKFILEKFTSLAKKGVISKLQQNNQQQEVDKTDAEIARFQEEIFRLQAAIKQAQARVENIKAVDKKDLTTHITSNNQKIADIDTQLTKAIIENNKRIAETDSQISQVNENIEQSVVKSPVDGIVFELKPNSRGFVANSTEPIVKIVPGTELVASVSINNKDIGFVEPGKLVDVRIDSFPYSEFGDVQGTLTLVGSDASQPTQIKPGYTFPAEIKLNQPFPTINGRKVKLKS
ncbi:MAG: HlyD family efflux transporter periplasmic adaptor subunit, partial [Cyanobacteria bacterium J06641_2]